MITIIEQKQGHTETMPWNHITLRDWEKIGKAVSAITLDPFKNSFYYAFPWFKLVQSGGWIPLYPKNSPHGQEQIEEKVITEDQRTQLFALIEQFKQLAKIQRTILPHLSNGESFSSVGGTYSISSPGLIIPDTKITKEQISGDTQFRIAREIGHIKKNDALIRLVMKIIIITAILIAFAAATHGIGILAGLAMFTTATTSTLSWTGYGLFFAITIPLHIYLEKYYQGQMDKEGLKLLAQKIKCDNEHLSEEKAKAQAKQIALKALYDEKEWNKSHRCFYITNEGDNRLDLSYPPLTERIKALESWEF